MKVCLDHPSPFFLAHGGFQIQIEQTQQALAKIGVDVEFVRWWDTSQKPDVIHYFGRPMASYIRFAHGKGIKVVIGELHTGMGSRPAMARRLQKALMTASKKILPGQFLGRLAWESYRLADACVALTPWEAKLMQTMFGAPAERVHVVPNGVEDIFFNEPDRKRGPWLVCTATITKRKRNLELARAAVEAGTPLWLIGNPYSPDDPAYREILPLVEKNPDILRYEGGINDRAVLARIYREARGFVLLSTMESLSISALEAAATSCPLLLSDLPWARETFETHAQYCPLTNSDGETARYLRKFYDEAPSLPLPEKPKTWLDVAERLKAIYSSLL